MWDSTLRSAFWTFHGLVQQHILPASPRKYFYRKVRFHYGYRHKYGPDTIKYTEIFNYIIFKVITRTGEPMWHLAVRETHLFIDRRYNFHNIVVVLRACVIVCKFRDHFLNILFFAQSVCGTYFPGTAVIIIRKTAGLLRRRKLFKNMTFSRVSIWKKEKNQSVLCNSTVTVSVMPNNNYIHIGYSIRGATIK